MNLYKLTDQSGYTNNNTQWEAGKTLKLRSKKNPALCSGDVIHAYRNPNLAFLINPCGANFRNPLIWEALGNVVIEDWGKVGCFELTTTRQLNAPEWTKNGLSKNVSVQFAILCAEAVLKFYEDKYPNDDRPRKAIKAAQEYLKTGSADAAAYAAADAADAAYAAADAAADAADAAAYAADAAADAAYAAYAASSAAYAAADKIDFCALADQAVKMITEASSAGIR